MKAAFKAIETLDLMVEQLTETVDDRLDAIDARLTLLEEMRKRVTEICTIEDEGLTLSERRCGMSREMGIDEHVERALHLLAIEFIKRDDKMEELEKRIVGIEYKYHQQKEEK